MEIKKIKEFLKQRGINPFMLIERNGRTEELYCILNEFNYHVKYETKNKIIKGLKDLDITD